MSAYSDRILSLNPKGYWRLGSNPLLDTSPNGNTLTAPVGTPVAVGGLIPTDTADGARLFNGHCFLAPDAAWVTAPPYTIEAWVISNQADAGFDKDLVVKVNGFIFRWHDVADFHFYYYDGGWVGPYGAGSVITVGTLTHLVVTDDGTNIRSYVNGVQIQNAARGSGGLTVDHTSQVAIGSIWNGSVINPFIGRIDEVAIYGTALSAATIQGNYTYGTTGPPVAQTVRVPSVWPPGSNVSIVGQFNVGTGHVVGASAGTQFGTPTVTVKVVTLVPVAGKTSAAAFGTITIKAGAVTRTMVGLGSAQQFGAVTPKTTTTRTVTGLGSAQQFGSLVFRVTLGSGGVLTAQAFGVPTIKTTVTRTVVGLGSAQAFGTVHVAIVQMVPVGGVGSAQSFGTLKLVWSQTVQVPGLPQQSGLRSIVGGVISGDGHFVGGTGLQFGFVKIIPGRTTVKLDTLGLGSAQQFGVPHIAFWQPLPVLGLPSAQAFGKPRVFLVWIRQSTCTDLDLAASTCTDLDLVTTTSDTLTLAATPVSTLDLTASEAEDLDLQPAGCS